MTHETIQIQLSQFAPAEICQVVSTTDKAVKLRNIDNGAVCFAPKSGLVLRNPGVPTYENEYVLAGWFRRKLDNRQERVFGVSE